MSDNEQSKREFTEFYKLWRTDSQAIFTFHLHAHSMCQSATRVPKEKHLQYLEGGDI